MVFSESYQKCFTTSSLETNYLVSCHYRMLLCRKSFRHTDTTKLCFALIIRVSCVGLEISCDYFTGFRVYKQASNFSSSCQRDQHFSKKNNVDCVWHTHNTSNPMQFMPLSRKPKGGAESSRESTALIHFASEIFNGESTLRYILVDTRRVKCVAV